MYYELVYSDELYHHGVKGMKWGVRKAERYERKAKKLERKAEKGLGIFRDSREARASRLRAGAANWRAASNEKTIKRKAQQLFGLEGQSRAMAEQSKLFERKANRSAGNFSRNINRAAAYNNKVMADYSMKAAKKSTNTSDRRKAMSIINTYDLPARTIFTNKKTKRWVAVGQAYAVSAGLLAANMALQYYQYRQQNG